MSPRQYRRDIEKRMRAMSENGGGVALKVIWAGVREHNDGSLHPCVACMSDLMFPDTGEDTPPIIFQSETPLPAFAIKEPKYLDDLQHELMEARL